MLQGGDEGQLHALAQLVARVGRREAVGQALVGVRLHPHRLDDRLAGPHMRVRRRPVVDRQHPLGAAGDDVQAGAGGDRVEPRAQGAAPLEALEAAPPAQLGILQRILRVVDGAEHSVAMRVQLRAIGLEQAPVGVLVPRLCRLQQRTFRHPGLEVREVCPAVRSGDPRAT